jgi:PAS domain S-box-containing protein
VTEEPLLLLVGPGGPSGGLARLCGGSLGAEVVDDLETVLARLRANDRRGTLVVVDPGWPRPLAAARRIREVDTSVGVAVAVAAEEVAATRSKLAFLPDVDGVEVLATDEGPVALRRRLADVEDAARQRRRVRGALDAMNRDLAGARPPSPERARSAVVSEGYLAALVRHAADTIVSIDPFGRIVSLNDAGQRTLGFDRSAVEGRDVRELLADDDPGQVLELVAAAEQGETRVDHELPLRLSNGRHLVLSATAAAVRDDVGAVAGLVVIARDITAERRAERRLQALQKAESLATLASGVAHDFNNLLVQVQGWADLARQDLDDRGLVVAALDHIAVATRQASELARAMLAYGGRGEFEPEPVDLPRLVADLRPLLTASVPAKIEMVIESGEEAQVRADPTQLRQVVLNLVLNAAEAIGETSGAVHLRTGVEHLDDGPVDHEGHRLLGAGTYAFLEVEDTGPGIEPDLHDRLFDPFFTTKFTGRGLGLAASQGIARAHDGLITVHSRPGEGARFRVHLPARR